MIEPQAQFAEMSGYAVAELTVSAGQQIYSLSQNESLRPPSPVALAAAGKSIEDAAAYPDSDWRLLRSALGRLHGIDPELILCGNGSLELIGTTAQVYGGPGRSVLAPVHAYPFFRTAALMSGARFDTAPENGLTVSVDHLVGAVREDTSIVFVANPGNPTGTRLPVSELRRLRAALRPEILLVIDEAYGEFADAIGDRCWDMVDAGNCIVLRTFSKAYGLAGLRIGWGLFPQSVAQNIRKGLNPNSVSSVAQVAAMAALEDQGYMQETCEITSESLEKWRAVLTDRGFDVHPSTTNFMLIRMANAQEAVHADAALRSEGIFLRGQGGAGLSEYLRITIAPDAVMTKAVSQLTKWKKEAQS